MTRTRLTWVVVGGLVALFVVGLIDSLRSRESRIFEPGGRRGSVFEARDPVLAPTTVSLPPCSDEQIGVSIEVLGGSATVVVRHMFGKPCHLARRPVEVAVNDRADNPVRSVPGVDEETDGSIEGDFTPGFERLLGFNHFANCDLSSGQRGPFTAKVWIGENYVERRLAGDEIGCWQGG
jgi:hypothetical protein